MFALRAALFAVGLFASGAMATADEMKFELYKDKGGEYRWRPKATNGAIMATPGQGYKALADAKSNIESVKKSATDDKMKYEVYEDAKKEHRWRLKAANGQVIGHSEMYSSTASMEGGIASVKKNAPIATVVDLAG